MQGNIKSSPPRYEFDDAPCGHLVLDSEGHIVEANKRLRNWLGMTTPELAEKHVSHVFSKASRIVFETSIAPLLSLKGRIDCASLDLSAKDGQKIPVMLSAETSGTGSKQVTTLVFLLAVARRNFEHDLSMARAEAEAQLSMSRREAELREQFVAILGHDLRNPLASISAAIRILSKEPMSKRGAGVIRLTQGSIRRMSMLIDNVLDFARNRLGGGIDLKISDDGVLENEIRQVVAELHSAHPDREIQMDLTNLKATRCDVSRIGQLVSNLLGNALTYGDPMQPIRILSRTYDGVFELSISNHGEPIPPSAMAHLFDPFVRSSNHADQMGLGLGLFIASEIANAHNGSLDVVSNEDCTTFTLRIPDARHDEELARG